MSLAATSIPRSLALIALTFSAPPMVGCSPGTTSVTRGSPTQTDKGGQRNGDPASDGTEPVNDPKLRPLDQCHCEADQVCDVEGLCVARPEADSGDIVGDVVLMRRIIEGDESLRADAGEGTAQFYVHEPLPNDPRQVIATADGERCTLQHAGDYPWLSPSGVTWPTKAKLTAGEVLFAVDGAPGKILLEPTFVSAQFGWGYDHGQDPPPLSDGRQIHANLFSSAYVPDAATFAVEQTGSKELEQMTHAGGQLAPRFEISSPTAKQEVRAADGLVVQWSPAQPGARMFVEIVSSASFGGVGSVLRCDVDDDGELQLTEEGLSDVAPAVTIELSRRMVRYRKTALSGGRTLHMTITGQLNRVRPIRLDD